MDLLTEEPHYLLTSDYAADGAYIDGLLQDTFLFVLDISNRPSQVRDEALFQRAWALVEAVQDTLKAQKESDEFINHILYAQCGLIDDVVLNTAPTSENHIWLHKHSPLQTWFVHEFRAGEALYERPRELLRRPAPDPRLLVLYQRIFAMGFGRFSAPVIRKDELRNQVMASLNALVPAGELPFSAPLVVEYRPGARRTLMRSRLFHLFVALLVTAGLWAGLQTSLHHLLQLALPG